MSKTEKPLTAAQRAYARVAHRLQRELVAVERDARGRVDAQLLTALGTASGLERARNIAAKMAWGARGYRLTLAQARRLLPPGWALERVPPRGCIGLFKNGASHMTTTPRALLRLVNAANCGDA